jgi:hypothetical protein
MQIDRTYFSTKKRVIWPDQDMNATMWGKADRQGGSCMCGNGRGGHQAAGSIGEKWQRELVMALPAHKK